MNCWFRHKSADQAVTGTQTRAGEMNEPQLLVCLGPLERLLNGFCAMQRMRDAWPDAHLTLLTSPSLAGLASRAPWLDEVITADMKAQDLNLGKLAKSIRAKKYSRIIDLQRDQQTQDLFAAFGLFPPRFASHAPRAKWRLADNGLHPVDADAALLDMMGVPDNGADRTAGPDLSWLTRVSGNAPSREPGYFNLETPFVLINLTEAQEGDWPDTALQEVARQILDRNIMVALTGGMAARERAKPLLREFPQIRDLCARADPFQLAGLGTHANCVIGMADGNMHLCAASGTRCISLHGSQKHARRDGIRAPGAVTVIAEPLNELSAAEVIRTMDMFGALITHKGKHPVQGA